MINRRALLAGSGALVLSATRSFAALPVPGNGRLSFKVFRKGSQIGEHHLIFTQQGDSLSVNVDVELLVKLGPIPLYRYTHRVTETWRGDTVATLRAETNDNGTRLSVTGENQGSGLAIVSTKAGSYVAPANALPATHWNRRMLDGPFVNTQTGELTRPTIVARGPEQITTASGRTLTAKRFVLSGPVRLETWYDDTPTWSALIFTAEDGTRVEYKRA